MELIKDIPFCTSTNSPFKLDLCLPESVNKTAIRKHIKFKSTQAINEEKKTFKGMKTYCPSGKHTDVYDRQMGVINELTDSDTEISRTKDSETKDDTSDRTWQQDREQSRPGKVPFVIFVHGGGWRRGGKQAWKHYIYHDVNFLVAILQWLLNVHRNVGISLAQKGIGCALISYPLSEQDMPYVFFEMLLSYIQSCFVTFLGVSPLGLLMHGPNHTSWMQVVTGNRYNYRLPLYILLVPFLTNVITLIIFTNKMEKFKLPAYFPVAMWLTTVLAIIWSNSLSVTYQLILLTLLTFLMTQGMILRRRLLRLGVTYSDQAKVVARAVHWAKRLALKSGQFDRERIYLMGHSAGGHLITLTVLDDSYLKEVRCSPQDIKGVISLAGVYDLDCLNAKILKQTYLVPNFGEYHSTWRKASPYHQVKKSKTTRRPKFLLMNAELDPVLVKQSHAFADKLTNSGLDCEHVTVYGSNHFTIVTNLVRIFGENDESVLKLTVDFIFKM